ncbi:hypothetical protein AFLA_014127 [Aspergillus flavus NRRL3357]|nr:hypothetical protein AFLA_014127 [Aspergillus flavus NRRL3357]
MFPIQYYHPANIFVARIVSQRLDLSAQSGHATEESSSWDFKVTNGKPLSRVKSVDKLKTALTMACVL